MQKVFGVVLAAVLLSTNNGSGVLPGDEISESGDFAGDEISFNVSDRETIDIAALLTAARGAPPLICSLASQSVRNGGWGWNDAPVTPLGKTYLMRDDDGNSRTISQADVQLLFAALASDDACVRELGVRLIGRSGNATITSGLIERLSASSSSLREIAALGLGMGEPKEAIDPLIRALRDSEVGVRANSAWALGHIESGRALDPRFLAALLVNAHRDEAGRLRLGPEDVPLLAQAGGVARAGRGLDVGVVDQAHRRTVVGGRDLGSRRVACVGGEARWAEGDS